MAEGEIFKGAAGAGLKGASAGAQIGSIVPGIGNLVGGAIGAGVGAITGGLKAKKSEEERKKALQLPGQEDPGQTARLLEIDRIAKNIQSGTDAGTQQAIQQGQETTAATQGRLARNTGGNIGATTDALIKAQKAGGQAANQAISQGQTRLPFFMSLGQQIANRAEQRKLELQLLGRSQGSAETAQDQKERNVNFNSGIATGETGQTAGDLGNAFKRIKSMMNNGQSQISEGGDTSAPNSGMFNGLKIGGESNPSVNLGSITEGMTEVGGLGASPSAGIF